MALLLVIATILCVQGTFFVPNVVGDRAAVKNERSRRNDFVPQYRTKFALQPIDHFGFFSASQPTFLQRYLVSTEYWNPTNGPILFYAGNEGDITDFANNTGWIWEHAPALEALVVFSECRYYGESVVPGGTYRYLSTQQILADHAMLARAVKSEYSAWDAATIAIGGSYGGMLAAWLRVQYPWQFDGALAASAPIKGFTETGVYDVMSQDFSCARDVWQAFRFVWTRRKNQTVRRHLASDLNLCETPSSDTDVEIVIGYLQQQLFVLAELDYPTPSRFIGRNLPANPAAVACRRMRSKSSLTSALSAAAAVANPDIGNASRPCVSLRGISFQEMLPGFIPGAWTFQRCSQVLIPYHVGNKSSAFLSCNEFPPNCWDFDAFASFCNRSYGVVPRDEATYFGGINLTKAASKIIFSNGNRDPWSAGGIHKNVSSSVIAIAIKDGAHHVDLRFSDPADPQSVRDARAREYEIVAGWVREKALLLSRRREGL